MSTIFEKIRFVLTLAFANWGNLWRFLCLPLLWVVVTILAFTTDRGSPRTTFGEIYEEWATVAVMNKLFNN